MKNKEAPFMCTNRVAHPPFTSRMMWIVDEKAVSVSAV
jgi:hypothetical protein